MGQDYVTGFERKVLFRIARFVAFTICFSLFVGLIGGAIYLATTTASDVEKPDPAQIVNGLKAEARTPGSTQDSSEPVTSNASGLLFGVQLPPALQESMVIPGNMEWLNSGLEQLPASQRQGCVDGLAAASVVATQSGIEQSDALNAFMSQCLSYSADRSAAESAALSQRLYALSALLSALILIALFSLVLVLMAIERNTRAPNDLRSRT